MDASRSLATYQMVWFAPLTPGISTLADWEFEEPEGTLHGGFTKRVTFDALREEFGYLPPDIEEEIAMYADS